MKRNTVALTMATLLSGVMVGCSNGDGGTVSTSTTTTPTTTTPAATTAGVGTAPTAPAAGTTGGIQPASGGAKAGAKTPPQTSWEVIAKRMNVTIPGGGAQVASAGDGTAAGTKPVTNGAPPAGGLRADPFESLIKFVIPEVPAATLALPRRLASPYVPPPPPISNEDPNLLRGPLPFVPRRVAGVMYNGAITAILETGDASSGARHDVIRPGSVVPFGLDGMPDLTVESITMSTLILRAPDGRTVEVKLSGLPPAVSDALRQQFSGGGGGGGVPGGGFGAPAGGGFGAPGGGGGKGAADL